MEANLELTEPKKKIWRSDLFWKTMYEDTREFIQRCRGYQFQGSIIVGMKCHSHTIFQSSYLTYIQMNPRVRYSLDMVTLLATLPLAFLHHGDLL